MRIGSQSARGTAEIAGAGCSGYVRLCALCVAAAFSAIQCTTDFAEVNTNPNAPVDVAPELLLRQVIYDHADHMSFEGFTGGANLGQYFSADPGFNRFDRGDLLAPQFGSNPWPRLYTQLRDVELVLAKARTEQSARVYEGPALVLRSLIAGTLTDLFGAIPYTQAAAGKSSAFTPAYDAQEDVYAGTGGILATLAEAVAIMDDYEGAFPLTGDELFGGALEGWIRMANSLRLRYLLRASDELGDRASTVMRAILAEGRFIDEGAEDAVFRFGGAPNDFGFARARVGDFNNYLMSATIDDVVDAFGDPRERVWFRETADNGFAGVPNGLPTGYGTDTASFPGRIFREESTRLKANFATAWETHFVLAEAATRGLVDADAEALYEEGVRLAFAYWDTPLPEGYLERDGVAYADDGDAGVRAIATQRWLASIGNGYEGWTVWRRTGFPEFTAPVASLNEGRWPIRFPYPVDEQALNPDNYEAAVAELGGSNSVNVAVWWDR